MSIKEITPTKVYIRINANSIITSINSEHFLDNLEGWIQIDEGFGDAYVHAQGNYLSKGLIDRNLNYNYKYIDGIIVEIPENEKPVPQKSATTNERLSALEEELKALLGV